MKALFTILLVIVATVAAVDLGRLKLVIGNNQNKGSSDPNTICAVDGSDGVLLPHEDCNKFYKCSEGKPAALACQQGLLYNPLNGWCDWPENIDCDGRVIPNEDNDGSDNSDNESNEVLWGNTDPSEAPAICAEESSQGILISHEVCSKFYQCAESIPVALDCGVGLLYNPNNGQCDWPMNVDCGSRVMPDEDADGSDNGPSEILWGNSDPSEAPAICAAEGSQGILISHEVCSKFYQCSEGIPVTLDCRDGLLYNPVNGQCDWPENVNCSLSVN